MHCDSSVAIAPLHNIERPEPVPSDQYRSKTVAQQAKRGAQNTAILANNKIRRVQITDPKLRQIKFHISESTNKFTITLKICTHTQNNNTINPGEGSSCTAHWRSDVRTLGVAADFESHTSRPLLLTKCHCQLVVTVVVTRDS